MKKRIVLTFSLYVLFNVVVSCVKEKNHYILPPEEMVAQIKEDFINENVVYYAIPKEKRKPKKEVNIEEEYSYLFGDWYLAGYFYDESGEKNEEPEIIGKEKEIDPSLKIYFNPDYPKSIFLYDYVNGETSEFNFVADNVFLYKEWSIRRIGYTVFSHLGLVIHNKNLISNWVYPTSMEKKSYYRLLYVKDKSDLPSKEVCDILQKPYSVD